MKPPERKPPESEPIETFPLPNPDTVVLSSLDIQRITYIAGWLLFSLEGSLKKYVQSPQGHRNHGFQNIKAVAEFCNRVGSITNPGSPDARVSASGNLVQFVTHVAKMIYGIQ